MIPVLQFAASPNAGFAVQNGSGDILSIVLLVVAVVPVIAFGLFILRKWLHIKKVENKAFNRILLQIKVPKERKSEGQGGQVGQEDRLEQIKEEIALTESFFASVAGLRVKKGFTPWLTGRDDHFSFEVVVHNQIITFYIDVPLKYKTYIEQQVHAIFSDAQITELTDYNMFSEKGSIVGAYVTAKRSAVFPMKTFKDMDADPMNGPLNALAKIYEQNSSASIQFVVRSAHKKWRSKGVHIVREVKKGKKFEDVISKNVLHGSMKAVGDLSREAFAPDKNKPQDESYQVSQKEEEMLKAIEDKISKAGMEVTLRVVCSSDNATTARQNLDNILNTFSQYNLYRYGNTFEAYIPRNQKRLIQSFIYRTFSNKRSFLANTEEMSGLWHLPLHSNETPNIAWALGRVSPPPANVPTEGLHIGYVDYRGMRTDINMMEGDRRRHMYIIGKSGSGKSVFISNLAIQDIKAGKGVCIVDPHGDLIEDVLAHVPKERAEDVIIFDPSDTDRPLGLNMLEAQTEEQRDFAVQEMISIFYKLFPPEMIGPMFEHQMRNVMLTLMADINMPGTIIDIPRMFTDDDFVKEYLKKLKDPVVRAFWEQEMAKTSDFHKSEMLGYLISKMGRFVENEMMRNIMGQQKSSLNFREAMDQKKILLVNLAKGKTGEVNAKLLGLIVVAKLQMAAMGRADMPEDQRSDFYLYIDEFQNFVTDSISTILSEARKYRLDLIIAHQYMGQLTDDKGRSDVRDAVLGNVGTICVGRVGPDDAEILSKEFVPTFGSYDLLNPPQFSYYTKMLIDNKGSKPFNMKTPAPKEGNRELAAAIKQLSRLKYGRDKAIVEAEILERTKIAEPMTKAKTDASEASL